jgi:hypothetical protein
VVTGEKNNSTVAHACRKRRLKWVLGTWGYNWATQSPADINMETWSSRLGLGVGLAIPHKKRTIVTKPSVWRRLKPTPGCNAKEEEEEEEDSKWSLSPPVFCIEPLRTSGRSSLNLFNSLPPCTRILLEKLTVTQLVKKLPAFYGIRRFITVFTTACYLSLSCQMHPVHNLPLYFPLIHCNIIFPSTPRSSEWFYLTTYSYQISKCIL